MSAFRISKGIFYQCPGWYHSGTISFFLQANLSDSCLLCFHNKSIQRQNNRTNIKSELWFSSTLLRVLKYIVMMTNEPAYDKTYNKTCATSNDSDQPVHPPSMTRVFVYPVLDSLEAVEGICDQRRLWSDCADAQDDQSLHWSHKSCCRFCRAMAKMIFFLLEIILYVKCTKPLHRITAGVFLLCLNLRTLQRLL